MLGIAVDQNLDAGTIRMSMELAISKLCRGVLTEHELAKSVTVDTPMIVSPLLKQTERTVSKAEFDYLSVVGSLLIRVVEYGTKPIPDRQPFVPLLRTGDGGRKEASWILDHNGSTELWSPLSPGGHGNCTSDHSPAFEEVRQKADFKLLQLECP